MCCQRKASTHCADGTTVQTTGSCIPADLILQSITYEFTCRRIPCLPLEVVTRYGSPTHVDEEEHDAYLNPQEPDMSRKPFYFSLHLRVKACAKQTAWGWDRHSDPSPWSHVQDPDKKPARIIAPRPDLDPVPTHALQRGHLSSSSIMFWLLCIHASIQIVTPDWHDNMSLPTVSGNLSLVGPGH